MSTAPQITVLVAEDHAIVRQGLCSLLHADGHFKVVAEAKNGREAVEMAACTRPDVILMDIGMPVLNGLEATRQILAAHPRARVVVLSAHSEAAYVKRMIQSGVSGFLEKQTSAEILTTVLLAVAEGGTYFSPVIPKALRENPITPRDWPEIAKSLGTALTSREMEVLQLVAESQANKQIATALSISFKTVEKHRQSLMDKLNIHDTAGLTRYAIATGVIEGHAHAPWAAL